MIKNDNYDIVVVINENQDNEKLLKFSSQEYDNSNDLILMAVSVWQGIIGRLNEHLEDENPDAKLLDDWIRSIKIFIDE